MASNITRKLAVIAADEGKTVDEVVIHAIKKAGSQTGAARLLGVNPNTIRYHVKRLGLQVTTEYTARVEVAL
jgi:transcriptional regulator with GAF, ATPase, and Fis domain